MRNLRTAGTLGEEQAVSVLKQEGFEIIARNFHHGKQAEIDIVAMRGKLVLFVEVKWRSCEAFGGALYSISEVKKRRLRSAATRFLVDNGFTGRDFIYRFDLIAFENNEFRWVQDMFR